MLRSRWAMNRRMPRSVQAGPSWHGIVSWGSILVGIKRLEDVRIFVPEELQDRAFFAMSMRISVERLNGKTLVLEVTPEMRMREVKQQIKDMHEWEDELSRDTTFVEVIFDNKKLGNDETVAAVGLSADSVVTVILRQNIARCSNKGGFGPDIDPQTLVVLEIPDSKVEVEVQAFEYCKLVASVIIPSSVRRIGRCAFSGCGALRHVTIPDSVTQIRDDAFRDCTSLTHVTIPDSVRHIWDGAFAFCSQLTLTAPARLLHPNVGEGIRAMVAKECGCGGCHYRRFEKGWDCPMHAGS